MLEKFNEKCKNILNESVGDRKASSRILTHAFVEYRIMNALLYRKFNDNVINNVKNYFEELIKKDLDGEEIQDDQFVNDVLGIISDEADETGVNVFKDIIKDELDKATGEAKLDADISKAKDESKKIIEKLK